MYRRTTECSPSFEFCDGLRKSFLLLNLVTTISLPLVIAAFNCTHFEHTLLIILFRMSDAVCESHLFWSWSPQHTLLLAKSVEWNLIQCKRWWNSNSCVIWLVVALNFWVKPKTRQTWIEDNEWTETILDSPKCLKWLKRAMHLLMCTCYVLCCVLVWHADSCVFFEIKKK